MLPKKAPVIDSDVDIDAKKFSREAARVIAKPKKEAVTFRFESEIIDLINEIAESMAGGNKTLAVKTAILALSEMTASEKREILYKVYSK